MRHDIIREQKAIWFLEEESTLHRRFSRLDTMYVDLASRDIPLQIMPIGGNSAARKDFGVSIEPHNPDLTRLIASALSERGSWYLTADIKRSVCNFVRQVAGRVLRYGKAVFEIVLLRNPETNELIGCDLFDINTRTLSFEGDNVYQQIPPKVAAERGVPTTIQLDPNRLAIFSQPSQFRRDLTAMIQALGHVGTSGLTRMYEASQYQSNLGYDIKEHIRAEHLAIAAATRSVGWDANQNFYELFTEYYILHRRLIFQEFLITLREAILERLNSVIGTIAVLFGTGARLEVTGLPTIADVSRAKNELATGSRTFGSVLDDFTLL
jgi:hypothetical protein